MIIVGKKDDKGDEYEKEEVKKEVVQNKKGELVFSLEDFGGYTPPQLVSKLEEAKDSISKGNAKEAMIALDNCIVRITGKKLDEEKESAVSPGYEFELDKALS
tara:strand:+ start:9441 stop:9749 length:309 start_codon:yes stop_codon:yes gene_type:complete